MKLWFLTIRSMFSGRAMRELYDLRRDLLEGAIRQRMPAVWVAAILVVLTSVLLISTTWVPSDMQSYMNTRSNIYQLPTASYSYITSGLVDADCSLINDCKNVLSNPFLLKEVDLNEIDKTRAVGPRDLTLYLRTSIATWSLDRLRNEPTVVVSLPRLRYQEAEIFWDNQHVRSFKRGERLYVNLDTEAVLAKPTLNLHVVMRLAPSERPIAGTRNNEGLFAASQSEFYRYRNYQIANSANGVGKMGHVAKIVLALFCLLLFLIVDSSPESLGLALFMGFEALAIGVGEGWLPLGWIGFGHERVLSNFSYQMGDILKLYFLLQLARVGPPSVKPWLIFGALLSVPYGFFMEFAYENSMTWVYKIPRARDTLVGGIGFLVCLHAIFSLRDKRIPWRITALTIGGVAALTEVVNSWIAHSDSMGIYPWAVTMFTVFQANTGYMFALSTFLNISNLESRIKLLTKERDKALEMKRQMELGQSVQKAFLRMPKLPSELGLASHHEAAKYVSGDTYFVHYDRGRQSLTFLLNDVTGHGVQAALKAFATNMIAKTIWLDQDEQQRPLVDRRQLPSRLARFDKLVDELICQSNENEIPDFNAMIGAEFFLETNKLQLYRANYSFPVIIEPRFDWRTGVAGKMAPFWKIESLGIANRTIVEMELKPGSLIVLVSDGYVVNARDEASLIRHLHRFLENHQGRMDAQKIRAAVINWTDGEAFHGTEDDRTILVFQWDPETVARLNQKDNPDLKSA